MCGVSLMCLFRSFLSLPGLCSCTSSHDVCTHTDVHSHVPSPARIAFRTDPQVDAMQSSDVLAQAATLEQGCAQTQLAVELLQAKETCTPREELAVTQKCTAEVDKQTKKRCRCPPQEREEAAREKAAAAAARAEAQNAEL